MQDDESGLIYMRARYYEPGSGRFISEDPARDGANWFVYCENAPQDLVDPGGETAKALAAALDWLAKLLTAANSVAVLTDSEKQFQALLGVITGVIDAVDLTCKLIAAASSDRRSVAVTFAAVQGILLLKTIAICWAVANLRLWIMLQEDPEADLQW